ncbi:MAG: hypothetical protein HDQ98_15480 [Lachnospiraceae bacterium]|nr:hypothetical protein [Lachnospiraceae bacterium]
MSIYMNMKTNYSSLFSSLSGSSSSGGSNFLGINLAEYASIKSGAYGKALKAYYAKNSTSKSGSTSNDSKTKETNSSKLQKDTAKQALSEIKNDASDLYSAANKLTTTGTKSLFNKKDITTTNEDGTKTTKNDYDRDAIYSAVKNFAKEYNSLIDSASSNAAGKNTSRTLSSMMSLTDVFKNQLEKVGITVESSGKLTVDEETFKKADMLKVKGLFNGSNSYAGNVGGYASTIGSNASSDLNYGKTYTASGSYSPFESGLSYNGYF